VNVPFLTGRRAGAGDLWAIYSPGSIVFGSARMATTPAFLFDLDGTLVDSVYQHVLS
jgi:hypothetical protein